MPKDSPSAGGRDHRVTRLLSIQRDLQRALKFQLCGDLIAAETIYQSILKADPNNADALHLLGMIAYQRGELDLALSRIERAVALDSCQSMFYNNLGNVFKAKGQLHQAVCCFQKAVRADPGNDRTRYALGTVLQLQGRLDEAVEVYHEALQQNPDNIDAWFKLALAEESLNRLQNAVSCYQRITAINPNLPQVFVNLGKVFKAMYRLQDAMASYQSALRIDPNISQAHNNLGTVLQQLGEFEPAIACFKKALEINPRYATAQLNLGNVYQVLGHLEKAIDCYRKALNVRPDFIAAYYHLGLAYQSLKNPDQAIDAFQKALSLNPEYTKAACYLYHQLQYTCDWQKLDAIGGRIESATREALKKGAKPDESPFLSISRRIRPALDLKIATAWSTAISQQMANIPKYFGPHGSPGYHRGVRGEKITLGYLSNNFKNHPTAHLISGMFRYHNRENFNVFCYSFGEDDGSDSRKQIETDCDRFIDIKMLSHGQAARHILDDQVDILIDMVGFTHGHRLYIAALRPAPVQVRWLGFAGSTGADFFDYLIADPIVAPLSHASFYSERLVHLPYCYQVNSRQQLPYDRRPQRKDEGLPKDAFVYCCFCTGYKLDPLMFDVWMRILKTVPSGVLWLLGGNKTAEKNLKKRARARGVNPARIVFGEPLPKDAHLARLACADLALDTRIVTGAATTSDALGVGVPVLTLQGGSFASRMSASIISAIGLPELITSDLETYQNLAVHLGQDPGQLSDIRVKLAQNRLRQPLFDTPGFTACLEKAYQKMWQFFASGEKARPIIVTDSCN
jgi:protein O-GlcNAc transferase